MCLCYIQIQFQYQLVPAIARMIVYKYTRIDGTSGCKRLRHTYLRTPQNDYQFIIGIFRTQKPYTAPGFR